MKHVIKALFLVVVIVIESFTLFPGKPWPVPEKDAKKINPIKINEESISIGKTLWIQHCTACHGRTGLGDGMLATQIKTPIENFSAENFQNQTDGSILYKITQGRGDMPSFGKKIQSEEDIWHLVNYIRSLKK